MTMGTIIMSSIMRWETIRVMMVSMGLSTALLIKDVTRSRQSFSKGSTAKNTDIN